MDVGTAELPMVISVANAVTPAVIALCGNSGKNAGLMIAANPPFLILSLLLKYPPTD